MMREAMELEAAPLPELPVECSGFMKLMVEHNQAQRIESECSSALPALRVEAARATEAAEAGEGDALLARIPQEQADKLARDAQAAREAVRQAERRGEAARRERVRLEAAIIAAREAAGEALRRWGSAAASPHAEGYAAALAALYGHLGALRAIQAATNASVLADTRHFRLPRRPTASDEPFAEVVLIAVPGVDQAVEMRIALEAAERMAWRPNAA
ncbi:hypothetical protein KTR66_03690 [Roseococcus sp. SDR]|uniref:hypothetical protein n=1 Tax=Roseococcus sp. SDR TaxID=2835532 RepID=UPI001BCFD92C|nr:hypothetical protein [Roseococcus sp. SDR]MBS7789082.1 hypothetical protein [Roseococcus sp. SDR]MBV1844396.1 hypothetical protein [Roseococcus sp. SDR]